MQQLLQPLRWRLNFIRATVYFVYHHQSTASELVLDVFSKFCVHVVHCVVFVRPKHQFN